MLGAWERARNIFLCSVLTELQNNRQYFCYFIIDGNSHPRYVHDAPPPSIVTAINQRRHRPFANNVLILSLPRPGVLSEASNEKSIGEISESI